MNPQSIAASNDDRPASREDFCRRNGLDPRRPIVLYLVSSRGAEPSPATFFPRWLAAVNESLPSGQALPNLADLLQDRCEKLLEQICMPISA